MANNIHDNQDNSIPQTPGSIIPATQNLAINLVRQKINALYEAEPDAETEANEVALETHRSKHQQFMYELMTSGKDLATIQTEWHEYYLGLSNEDKKQVWQEFYNSNKNAADRAQAETTKQQVDQSASEPSPQVRQAINKSQGRQAQKLAQHVHERANKRPRTNNKNSTVATIRNNLRTKATASPKLTWKHHLQSALFGLGMGAIVVFILLFGFFNEVIIAPFIQPSRNDTATPIILSNDTVAPSPTPEVIIPKINVEIPVDYNVTSTNENVIENDLNGGVVHYPTTSYPGQTGNAAYFGHSSNNIFNPGKYKFAFVLLHDLVAGDVFYLTYNDKVYAYKVFSTTIVSPTDVSVLDPIAGHAATATLITCDPPGTSINRLVVVGDQISPSPSSDTVPANPITTANSTSRLPGNGPTLWHRFFSTIYGKLLTIMVIGVAGWLIWRWYAKEFKRPAKTQ